MELLFKITSKCNFKCSFCSAANLKIDDFEKIKDKFYKKLVEVDPICLYIDGGDPLLVDQQIYWDIIQFIKDNNLRTSQISLTTNLWDFYINPDKWVELFKHPMIDITTSFQYGNQRISPEGVYTEETFRKVVQLYKEKIKKDLTFIAVIDEENEKDCLKLANLAKELDLGFRLNPVSVVGRSLKFYPRYKIIKIWIELVKAGFMDKNVYSYRLRHCPFTYNCKNTLYAFFYENGEEHFTSCNLFQELSIDNPNFRDKTNLPFMNKCLGCSMFKICCACTGQRYQINLLSEEEKEDYCNKMLELQDEVKQWLE